MDPARSESAHQDVPVRSSTLILQMTRDALSMETTRVEEGNSTAFHEILDFKLDGSQTTSTGQAGIPVTGSAHWDGSKLVIETERNIHASTVTTRYVYSLAPGGRIMTVDKTLTVQHGYQGTFGSNTGKGKDVFVRVKK